MSTSTRRPLWKCPKCRRAFANRNQRHACAALNLEHHFVGKDPAVRVLFEHLLRKLRGFGPVTVLPEKTRIAFQVRMSFAQVTPRRTYLVGHLVLDRVSSRAAFNRVETISPRNRVHHFRLNSRADLNRDFIAHLAQAYAVGQQRHLTRPAQDRDG